MDKKIREFFNGVLNDGVSPISSRGPEKTAESLNELIKRLLPKKASKAPETENVLVSQLKAPEPQSEPKAEVKKVEAMPEKKMEKKHRKKEA